VKFFLPGAQTSDQAERVYGKIVATIEAARGPVSPRRIYSISYTHNGHSVAAMVGEIDPLQGEVIVAILRSGDGQSPCYYVCTANRGVVRGEPMVADGTWRTSAIDFE